MRPIVFAIAAASLFALLPSCGADEPFQPLFNGRDLSGWKGDAALWEVKEGVIVGQTHAKKITKNTFLIHDAPAKNFVLRLKFKLTNGNSGIQFRSQALDDYVVRGYQADIADQRYMGILYEEGKRGILKDVADPAEVAKHIRAGDWNDYVITADGAHITQTINGHTTVDYTEASDAGAKEGVLALQLHVGPPMKVEFKDVELKVLP